MRRRTVICFTLILLLMCGVILRVYQLTDGALSQAADQQASMTVHVASARGTIYDRNLTPLNNTGREYRAAVTPAAAAVAALAGCVEEEALEGVSSRLQGGKPVVASLVQPTPPTQGITLFTVPKRYEGTLLAPHVVGYLSGDGINGAAGMELFYNDYLQEHGGTASVTYRADAMGRPLQGIEPQVTDTLADARAGIALTIDADIQRIAENAARQFIRKGAVVVTEPATGRILAMVSLPDFQPDTLADSLEDDDAPLVNRALSNYNCGSVFKIVSAAAALEAGVPVSTSYSCVGSIDVGSIPFHCHNRLGHGLLGMYQAFAESCNPYFIHLMLQTGGDRLYNMAVNLGFDRPIPLADGMRTDRAVMPSLESLQAPAEVANFAFGQGSLLASPVHLAQLVGTVVNDGELVRPTLILGTVDADGQLHEEAPAARQQAFSKSTAVRLREMMEKAVEEGTGRNGRPFEGGAGAKTGTAETGWKVDGREVVQGWYAGYYPAQEPRYVVVVLAEDTDGTGGKSTPVFKQICEELNMLEKARG
ncbi:MAG: penicillin-binding protein 2 [Clostridiales bacterium]|nr:penicillin-binding protein 2 [Clostridiales bacterium]